MSSRRSLGEGLSLSGRTFEASPNGGESRITSQRPVEPTDEWAELELLLEWPEQVEYERIRPAAIFGGSVAERSRETGTPETTLRRRITSFKSHGMRGVFEPERFEMSRLDPEVQGLILNLKADYPPMRDNEIATICYVRFGKRPHGRSVRRILEANPTAIRMFRRFKPYHETEGIVERRLATVTLHSEGWNVKSIAGYLKTGRPTVYRTLKKWIEEDVYSLRDKPRGAKNKIDLRAMNEVRKLQENPELGEFRVSAALAQLGIYLSPAPAGASSLSTASSTASKNRSGVPRRRRRCRSSPAGGTRYGAWTFATSTITCRVRARSTLSPSWATTQGRCLRARSRPLRT